MVPLMEFGFKPDCIRPVLGHGADIQLHFLTVSGKSNKVAAPCIQTQVADAQRTAEQLREHIVQLYAIE